MVGSMSVCVFLERMRSVVLNSQNPKNESINNIRRNSKPGRRIPKIKKKDNLLGIQKGITFHPRPRFLVAITHKLKHNVDT